MIETLKAWDLALFQLVNDSWSNDFFNQWMPWLRNKYIWAPLYAFIFFFLVINYKREGWFIVLFLALTILVSDQLSSSFIKPLVGRLRPCNTPGLLEEVNLLVSCGAGKSFPSSHATNHFAVAFFLGAVFWHKSRWPAVIGLVWAAAVSYAQIYVGLHFPFDVLGGAVIGTTLGIFLAWLCWRTIRKSF